MDSSFNFTAYLRNNEKKHKSKPSQFVCVADGIAKRLETNIKNRKSNRLTIFDRIRNLPVHDSPAKPNPQSKVEHRRQQLEKWKEEKEKKKKEAASQKKKPFLTGVARAPVKYVPPPPPKPSTSGRVTRAQSAKTRESIHSNAKPKNINSFAPKNAVFKAPELKNVVKLPVLAPPSKSKSKKTFTFEPVPENRPSSTARQTRSNTTYNNRQPATQPKPIQSKVQNDTKSVPSKVKKPAQTAKSRFTMTISKNVKVESTKTKASRNYVAIPTKELKSKQLLLSSSSEESTKTEQSPIKGPTKRKSLRKSVISINESVSDKQSSQSSSSLDDVQTSSEKKTQKSSKSVFSISSNSSVEFIEADSPKKYPVTPKNKVVPKSESGSEEKLRSPATPKAPLTPEQIDLVKKISPCVTLSRGKENARKEMKWKIDEGYLDDDTVELDSVDHFRQQLASEISRMTGMCEIWDKILEQTVLPESVQEEVLSAVGQARLLMSQKLQQFASLVERCARPDAAAALVTPADLQGFWDMVFMQVENVDTRFKKLEALRARNWVAEEPAQVKKAAARPAAKRAAKPAATSRIKDMIAAARKAKQQDSGGLGTKTFEAGFFVVRSPVRSPHTPAKHTPLLKTVLSSEANKSAAKNSASFAMLRASILGKNAEYDGIEPLPGTPQMTPINLYATPGRSILKSVHTPKPTGKCTKLVLFTDNDLDVSSSTSEEISNRYLTSEETSPNKENAETSSHVLEDKKPSKRLARQNALDGLDTVSSAILTRTRRKSNQAAKDITETESVTKTKSGKKPASHGKSQKQSGRKNKAHIEVDEEIVEKTPRKSKKALQEIENLMDEAVTPRRSLRPRKSVHNV